MGHLINQPTKGDIKAALQDLGQGLEGLDTVYAAAMERIQGQDRPVRKIALRVLAFIVYSRRPVTFHELRHALAVKPGTEEIDEDFCPSKTVILSKCAGLVTIEEESQIVRLVHYTIQEFFQRTGDVWFPDAKEDIATVCLTYLTYKTFDVECDYPSQAMLLLDSHPFLEYASTHWSYHTTESGQVDGLALKFLRSSRQVNVSWFFYMGHYSRVSSNEDKIKNPDALRIATTLGHLELFQKLLEVHDSDSLQEAMRKGQ